MTVETLFWNKWLKAREMDRIKMIQTLTGFRNKDSHSLYNSYFEDLEEIVRKDERAKCEREKHKCSLDCMCGRTHDIMVENGKIVYQQFTGESLEYQKAQDIIDNLIIEVDKNGNARIDMEYLEKLKKEGVIMNPLRNPSLKAGVSRRGKED